MPSNEERKLKVRVEGLSCANCALKIEEAWHKDKEVGESTINFATKTVYLRPAALTRAQELADYIEPGVRLLPMGASQENVVEHEAIRSQRELLRLVLAGFLFALGLWTAHVLTVAGWISSIFYGMAYLLVGGRVLRKAALNIKRGQVFDENFLMSLATIGAIAINQLAEAAGVMLFYAVGEYIENLALNRSRRSIQALLDIRPQSARVIRGLDTVQVDPEEVAVGEEVLVHPGEKIPLDGEITSGVALIDTSALTGESVPKQVWPGEVVMAGAINTNGVLRLRVTRPFRESSVQRILELVENAGARKAPTEKFITAFARYYTPSVVAVALSVALIPPLFLGEGWVDSLYRALTILVISCPCALVISIPLGYFGGIGGAAKHGILVKGANFLDGLRSVKTVVFDKTGTLTEGVFEVVQVIPFPGFTENEVLSYAAKAETYSSHPIAQSIVRRAELIANQDSPIVFTEQPGLGVAASFAHQEIMVGKAQLLENAGIKVPAGQRGAEPGTIVHVGVDGRYAGKIVISDRIKDGAVATINELEAAGIRTIMLSGDTVQAVSSVAQQLNIKEYYGDLLPEDKVTRLETLMQAHGPRDKVMFVGDGINDAPVLARADIGVAMGAIGSEAAIEAADVVLLEDDLSKLLTAMGVAAYTKRIVWQNIVLALTIKGVFLFLGAGGNITMWEAVFADVGVALLAILNATRVRLYHEPGQI